jgi:hypothetical protein
VLFRSILPGGAATPIGAAFQRSGIPKDQQLSDSDRRKATLIDAAATGISKAQPFIERIVKSTPPVVQQSVSKGLNTLPFSANLFGRYYTGIGSTGLQIPETLTSKISEAINKPTYRQNIIDNSLKEEKDLSAFLNSSNTAETGMRDARAFTNNALAETRSRLKRMNAGDIPYSSYSYGEDRNPLTSPSTSIGKVWFSPNKNGYVANEKYDFVYGAADEKVPMVQLPKGIVELNPSQEAALTSAIGVQGIGNLIPSASAHPLTFFGRSVVMKMPDKSFTYPINIR